MLAVYTLVLLHHPERPHVSLLNPLKSFSQVLMALTSAIEAAWIKVNSSKQPELKDLHNLTVCAGQMEQFGVNSFALSTLCNGMVWLALMTMILSVFFVVAVTARLSREYLLRLLHDLRS